MTLERRKPLRRGKPLQGRATLARRARLQPVSKARRGKRDEHRAVRDEVFARDGWTCRLAEHVGDIVTTDLLGTRTRVVPDCWGPLTFHHRRKAGAQGAYTEANGLTLCAGGNGWVEDNPDAAQALAGTVLVVRPGDAEWDALGKRAARG